MARGRKPAPKAIKELRGTRADRVNHDEPRHAPGPPAPPEWLRPEARDQFAQLVAVLDPATLTRADATALAATAETIAQMIDALRGVQKYGAVVPTGTGSVKAAPHLLHASEAMKSLRSWLSEFGATPAARQRLKTAAPAAAEESALAAFVRRRPVAAVPHSTSKSSRTSAPPHRRAKPQ